MGAEKGADCKNIAKNSKNIGFSLEICAKVY